MRHGRDMALFIGAAFVYSLVLALLIRHTLSNAMFAIAITSVILAARGIEWRRKITYAVIALGGFVAFDRLFAVLGLTERMSGFGFESAGTALGLIYIVATFAYPLAVLVLVAGRDPSVLWAHRPRSETSEASRSEDPGAHT